MSEENCNISCWPVVIVSSVCTFKLMYILSTTLLRKHFKSKKSVVSSSRTLWLANIMPCGRKLMFRRRKEQQYYTLSISSNFRPSENVTFKTLLKWFKPGHRGRRFILERWLWVLSDSTAYQITHCASKTDSESRPRSSRRVSSVGHKCPPLTPESSKWRVSKDRARWGSELLTDQKAFWLMLIGQKNY